MTTNHSDFSFDTYPGLDADLTAAYERNVTLGTAEPSEEIAGAGLAAAVGNALHQTSSTSPDLMAEEVHDWSAPELNEAIGKWQAYHPNLLSGSIPSSIERIAATNPNFAATMNRLYGVKEAISNPGDTNPEGLALGDTMHLALVPWQAMRDHLDDLQAWVKEMRGAQGLASNTEDFINTNLLKAIQEDKPLYRDLVSPDVRLLSARDYLDKKIAENGPWGIMLAQTSNQAGIDRLKGQSPNKMTDNGNRRLTMNNQVLDQMGIFEWLALTLQEDPTQLSSSDFSWLLANRLTLDNGAVQVPDGYFDGGQVRSDLGGAGNVSGSARVRLAVM